MYTYLMQASLTTAIEFLPRASDERLKLAPQWSLIASEKRAKPDISLEA